jgi:hypothetical protein
MIEALDLDPFRLATEIAIALAVAQVDAMDAEFVLGSARARKLKRAYTIEPSTIVIPPPKDVT